MWNAMIGSDRHDVLISEDSQELKNLRGVGGRSPFIVRRLPEAVHSGPDGTARNDKIELRSFRTQTALGELRRLVEGN
jgi:hypothetical protein